MRRIGLWVGVLAAFNFGPGCDHRGDSPAQPGGGRTPAWQPDPSLHDPVPPANPLPEPPLDADGTLHAIWAYETPNEVHFDGVTDTWGNLYWIERAADGSSEVVSFDWDGLERWRSPIAGTLPPEIPDGILLVAGDHVVLELRDQDGPTCHRDVHLVALRASNGTLAWRRTLGSDIPPDPAFYLSCVAAAGQAAASGDALFVDVTRCTRSDDCRASLDAFEISSGARRFAHRFPGTPTSVQHGWHARPAVDEAGDVHAVEGGEFAVIAASGVPVEARPYAYHYDMVAVASGVVIGTPSEYDPATGTFKAQYDAATGDAIVGTHDGGPSPPLAMSGTAIFTAGVSQRLARWRLGAGSPTWMVNLPMTAEVMGSLVLTSAGTIVVHGCPYDWPAPVGGGTDTCYLHELDVDGHEHYRIPLPAGFGDGVGERIATPASLHDARWVTASPTAVRSFDLPGRRVAAKGWVTIHGSMAGDRRAR